jgi:hypothetical protein
VLKCLPHRPAAAARKAPAWGLAAWLALLAAVPPAGAAPAGAPPDATSSRAASCSVPPALPTAPPARGALQVTEFGARADDDRDDTAALQVALDALEPGQWLVFPPGRYLHDAALFVRRRGVTLWGAGATLHATNPQSQAVVLAEDGISLLNFTLTAVTDQRRSAPQHSRIAVWRRDDPERPVRGAVVRGNRIVAGGPPGSPQANSASAGGIFLMRAHDFLVADNRVERTLADGIHVTGGSRDGRVLNNTVLETGDDMIGLVSYLGDGSFTRNSAAELAASLAQRRERKLVRNVLVAGNQLKGQYWGRGISVVGGEDITIEHNRVADATRAAAIYLAREGNYVTFGVRNVRVQDNDIARVQTTLPAYSAGKAMLNRRSGHAAILLHADLFEDESRLPALADALALQDIAILGNHIQEAASGGIRVNDTRTGPLVGGPMMRGRRGDGAMVERRLTAATVQGVVVRGNRLEGIRGAALAWPRQAAAGLLQCADNLVDGRGAKEDAACRRSRGGVPGAAARGAALAGCATP